MHIYYKIVANKQNINHLIERIYQLIFRQSAGKEIIVFIDNLSLSFIGGIVPSFIMLFTSFYASKLLGPTKFGEYNSMVSISMAIVPFMLLGIDFSSIRFLADKTYSKTFKSIYSSTLFITSLQTIIITSISSIIYYIFRKSITLNPISFIIIISTAILFTYKTIFDSILRALNHIKFQTYIKIIESLTVTFLIVLVFITKKNLSILAYLLCMIFGYLLFSVFSLFKTRTFINFRNINSVKMILHFNKYLLFASLGSFLINSEKYFIARYISTYDLGIYSAYQMLSTLVISNIGSIFINVFLPSVVNNKNKIQVFTNKLLKILIMFYPFWLLISGTVTLIYINLLGNKYPINLGYALAVSSAGYFSFTFSILLSMLKVIKVKESISFSIFCYLAIIISIIFSKNIGTYLFIQNILFISYIYIIQRKLTRKNENSLFTI